MLESIPAIRDHIPGNVKRYLTLFGCMLIEISLFVYFTSGNMAPYMISYLRERSSSSIRYSSIAWFNSIYSLLQAVSSVLAGIIIRKFKLNPRLVIILSSMVYCLGIGLSYFSVNHSFGLLLVTYCVITGCASGSCYILPLQFGMDWFPNRKGFANSVILFGYGMSSLVYSQIQTRFINPTNFSPDKPFNNDNSTSEKYFSQDELLDHIPNSFLFLAAVCFSMQLIGWSFIFVAPKNEKQYSDENIEMKNSSIKILDERMVSNKNSLGINMNDPNDGFKLREVIRLKEYYIIFMLYTLSGLAPTLIFSFYKIFAQEFINDDLFLTSINSISGIFNATGRFIWGLLIDKFTFKACYISLNSGLALTVGTIYFHSFLKSKYLYAAWIFIIYALQCGTHVLTPTIVAKVFGRKDFTSVYGSLMLLANISQVIQILLSELQHIIGWLAIYLISASLAVIGIIVVLFFKVKNSNGRNI